MGLEAIFPLVSASTILVSIGGSDMEPQWIMRHTHNSSTDAVLQCSNFPGLAGSREANPFLFAFLPAELQPSLQGNISFFQHSSSKGLQNGLRLFTIR